MTIDDVLNLVAKRAESYREDARKIFPVPELNVSVSMGDNYLNIGSSMRALAMEIRDANERDSVDLTLTDRCGRDGCRGTLLPAPNHNARFAASGSATVDLQCSRCSVQSVAHFTWDAPRNGSGSE